ncbi:MAG: Asp-tRNA(Asn)/Glu-tRNA(Gln) amidotransferase subunit GatB [Candidatus Omnitrophota bacterium]
MAEYDTVIGLETHVQLSTETKVFCGCRNVFGEKPNSCVCPVCLGHPGTLPVLNKKAFEHAIKVALALDCSVQRVIKFDRKNYYYPDLPKNYQISQYDMPIAYNGIVSIRDGEGNTKNIGVTRAHLEEDAGKLIHDTGGSFSYVDLNRTGTPLLEIVSEPEMNSPDEAYMYLVELKRIVKYLGVSDCNMEEGSLRCDANISLKPGGAEELGSKVEIKNLNSFKAVREAIVYEVLRQKEILDDAGRIAQETRLWDEKKGITVSMRSKEEAQDYRYFPEPDLVPFEVEESLINSIKKDLPELASAKSERFRREYGLPEKDLEILISERETADFFEDTVKIYPAFQHVSNWIKGEMLMHVKEKGKDINSLGVSPEEFAEIIEMSVSGRISALSAKEVLKKTIETGEKPSSIVEKGSMEQLSDTGMLEDIVTRVVSENKKSVNDYRSGKEAALSFLVGQVMRSSKGKANPKVAGEMLRKRIL